MLVAVMVVTAVAVAHTVPVVVVDAVAPVAVAVATAQRAHLATLVAREMMADAVMAASRFKVMGSPVTMHLAALVHGHLKTAADQVAVILVAAVQPLGQHKAVSQTRCAPALT